jgi:hypothetical protein
MFTQWQTNALKCELEQFIYAGYVPTGNVPARPSIVELSQGGYSILFCCMGITELVLTLSLGTRKNIYYRSAIDSSFTYL